MASPETTIANFLHARRVPGSAFVPHTRVVCLPGFTTTVREEIAALEEVAGPEAVALIRREPDATIRGIVAGWPRNFDPARARAFGFDADASFQDIIRAHIRDTAAAG